MQPSSQKSIQSKAKLHNSQNSKSPIISERDKQQEIYQNDYSQDIKDVISDSSLEENIQLYLENEINEKQSELQEILSKVMNLVIKEELLQNIIEDENMTQNTSIIRQEISSVGSTDLNDQFKNVSQSNIHQPIYSVQEDEESQNSSISILCPNIKSQNSIKVGSECSIEDETFNTPSQVNRTPMPFLRSLFKSPMLQFNNTIKQKYGQTEKKKRSAYVAQNSSQFINDQYYYNSFIQQNRIQSHKRKWTKNDIWQKNYKSNKSILAITKQSLMDKEEIIKATKESKCLPKKVVFEDIHYLYKDVIMNYELGYMYEFILVDLSLPSLVKIIPLIQNFRQQNIGIPKTYICGYGGNNLDLKNYIDLFIEFRVTGQQLSRIYKEIHIKKQNQLIDKD